MKTFLFIILCLFSNKLFSQTLFAINDSTQQIIVSKAHWYNNKIEEIEKIEKINCKDNELLYEFIVKLTKIAKESPVNKEIFSVIDRECKKQYSSK